MKINKTRVDTCLFILAIVIYVMMVLETLIQSYSELFLTFFVINIISIVLECLSYFSTKRFLSFIGIGLSIALVVLMIGFPSFYSYTGIIGLPILLIGKIIYLIKCKIRLMEKDKTAPQ